MMGEYFRVAMLCLLGALLIVAAVTDLRSRIISNRLNLTITALAPLWWLASGMAIWPDMAVQLLTAAIVFAVFTGLFSLGWMGGGDVKLLGALALWFPWQGIMALIVIMAVLGGVVTIATVVHHRMTRRLGQPQIPYGIAISLSALWLIWPTIF